LPEKAPPQKISVSTFHIVKILDVVSQWAFLDCIISREKLSLCKGEKTEGKGKKSELDFLYNTWNIGVFW